jgi:hypothetical protein
MKEANEIDQLFEESLRGLTVEPSAKAWGNIASGLDAAAAGGASTASSGRAKYLMWVLLGTIAAILASIFFFTQSRSEIKTTDHNSIANINTNSTADIVVVENEQSNETIEFNSEKDNNQTPENEATIIEDNSEAVTVSTSINNADARINENNSQTKVVERSPMSFRSAATTSSIVSSSKSAKKIQEEINSKSTNAVLETEIAIIEESTQVDTKLENSTSATQNVVLESSNETNKSVVETEKVSTQPAVVKNNQLQEANTLQEASETKIESQEEAIVENKSEVKAEQQEEISSSEETSSKEMGSESNATVPSPTETAGTHFATGWSVDVFGGPAWINNTEPINQDEGQAIYQTSMEKNILTPNLGLNLKYHVNNWFVQSGLTYAEYGENRNYTNNIEMHDTSGYSKQNINEYYSYDSVGFYIDPSNPTVVITLYDAIKHSDTSYSWISEDSLYYEHHNIYAQNRFRYIEIPLMVGYEFRFKNLGLEVSTGVSFGFRVNSSGKFLDSNNELIDINKSNSPYSNTMMNYLLSVGVKYHLTNRFSIIAQPTYKTNISSLFSSGATTSYNNFGLNVGLNYTIK